MTQSRRSILRNIGLLCGGSALPAVSLPLAPLLAGCTSQSTTSLIFAGPWLFSRATDPNNPSGPELLAATSIGNASPNAMHHCQVGIPSGKLLKDLTATDSPSPSTRATMGF